MRRAIVVALILVVSVLAPCVAQDSFEDRIARPKVELVGGDSAESIVFEGASRVVPSDRIERRAEIYPNEIYFGDPVYFVATARSLLDKEITLCGSGLIANSVYSAFPRECVLLYDGEEYHFSQERPEKIGLILDNLIRSRYSAVIALPPKGEVVESRAALDMPPLEDWNAPFWEKIKRDLEINESVTATLRVSYYISIEKKPSDARPQNVEAFVETPIVIKRRPDAEMALLDKWRVATPDELMPTSPSKRTRPFSGTNPILINDRKYSPWFFLRPGNRKPSDPNAPQTVQAWRLLEDRFVPSSTRDEITMTRLILKFYAAQERERRDRANELVAWFESLPYPQRVVYESYVLAQGDEFHALQFGNQPPPNELTDAYVILSSAVGKSYDRLMREDKE